MTHREVWEALYDGKELVDQYGNTVEHSMQFFIKREGEGYQRVREDEVYVKGYNLPKSSRRSW